MSEQIAFLAGAARKLGVNIASIITELSIGRAEYGRLGSLVECGDLILLDLEAKFLMVKVFVPCHKTDQITCELFELDNYLKSIEILVNGNFSGSMNAEANDMPCLITGHMKGVLATILKIRDYCSPVK